MLSGRVWPRSDPRPRPCLRGGSHRPSRCKDRAGARARHMCRRRPLRRFDPRLSGRSAISIRAHPALEASSSADRGRILPSSSISTTEIGLAPGAQARKSKRADRFERETLAFHQTLRRPFSILRRQSLSVAWSIDALAPEAVAAILWRASRERLLAPAGPESGGTMPPARGRVSPEADRFGRRPHPREAIVLFGHSQAEATPCSMPIAAEGCRRPSHRRAGGRRQGDAGLALRALRARSSRSRERAVRARQASTSTPTTRPRETFSRSVPPGSRPAAAGMEPKDKRIFHRDPRRGGPHALQVVPACGRARAAGACAFSMRGRPQPRGANALLKLIEEPPPRSLFLISRTVRARDCRLSARAAACCSCRRWRRPTLCGRRRASDEPWI